MTASCTTSRRSIVDRVLCFAVGALGLLLLYVALTAPPTTWSGMIAGLVLVSLSVIAALQHWGPIIPCMFFGMIAFSLLTSPISSSHEEAAFKAFGVPLIGAVIGAIFGVIWESTRKTSSIKCPDSATTNMHGSNDEQSGKGHPRG